ncbi:MAG: FAD-dependent oxidoreductase [Cyclobacteriaceae bacterium]|nr:FAD-dependent oxidoreductase [Cyclobacteriaceae bacterium]
MQKEIVLDVLPEVAADAEQLRKAVSAKAGIDQKEIRHVEILRRSIDARRKPVRLQLKVLIYIHEDRIPERVQKPEAGDVSGKEPVIIIGAGPAGLFAALKCISLGKRPVILERGKDVQSRRRDLRAITIDHLVNEDSNYCFGEGGAGTYSDGKLYTRSKKRGDVSEILKLLVAFGASRDILIDAHPHIGTNKLPGIIQEIRAYILSHGGQIVFNTRVTDLIIVNGQISGVKTASGESIDGKKVILATGHSARDIYEMLHRQKVAIEAKPFALGVRVEHPQSLIDSIQYHCPVRGEFLPPAPYSIVRQAGGRGVYSFCMCPGGIIAPCATSPGEVVTNGWSPSKRDQPTANSGIVVELRMDDFSKFASHGPLAAMEFQRSVEQKAWQEGGRTQRVPAQRLVDFIKGKQSFNLPETSYKPGVTSVELGSVLPEFINRNLKEGFKLFGKSMEGYITNEAVVHAPESRTSSPVRIPRDKETLEHIQIKGLYPCGEGAGYAGGIISAAIDGMLSAEKCVESMK